MTVKQKIPTTTRSARLYTYFTWVDGDGKRHLCTKRPGGITARSFVSTLTPDDLTDEKLWTLRPPAAWAKEIVAGDGH